MLLGAKNDLPKKVPTADAKDFADQIGLPFIETSSATNENVFEAFSNLAITIAEKLEVDLDVTSGVKDGQEKTVEKSSGSDDESFSEEDLTKGMLDGLKKQDEDSAKPKEEKSEKKKKVKASKANVNVFRLDLSALNNEAPVLTGDPVSTNKVLHLLIYCQVRCGGCGAMLNLHSNVTDTSVEDVEHILKEKPSAATLELAPPIHIKFEHCIATDLTSAQKCSKIWKCEFCSFVNVVDLDEEEIEQIKQNATLDFLVQQPEAIDTDNSRTVVFCIDISGSTYTFVNPI